MVAGFLTEHQGDFEIGVEPGRGLPRQDRSRPRPPAGWSAQIKRMQRVYQLTPDDTSMSMLLRHNLDSAFAITRYDAAGFIRAFSDKLGGGRRGGQGGGDPRPGQAGLRLDAERGRRVPGRQARPGLGGVTPIQYGFAPPAAPPDFPVTAYPPRWRTCSDRSTTATALTAARS